MDKQILEKINKVSAMRSAGEGKLCYDDTVTFNPMDFYQDYPQRIIERVGYPCRATQRSFAAWSRMGQALACLAGDVLRVADIGGCFGFGLNASLTWASKIFGHDVQGDNYELSDTYARIGAQLFPDIRFRNEDFISAELQQPYDLTCMFDVLEHIVDPAAMLSAVAAKSRFLMINQPLEATEKRIKRIEEGKEPPIPTGDAHPDGHIHFFTLSSFLHLVEESFCVCELSVLSPYEQGPRELLSPESLTREMILNRRQPFWWQECFAVARARWWKERYIRDIKSGLRAGRVVMLVQPRV